MSAAHLSAAAMVFSGRSGFPTCGKIEKSTTPSVLSPAGECQVTKSLSDTGGHHHAPGAQSHPDRLAQRRQEVCEAGRSHPVAQVRGIAAFDKQDVCLSDHGDPALLIEAGQRGELQHAQGLPTQSNHGALRFLSADEPPRIARTGHGVPVHGRGNAEGIALGNRLAQQVDQRVVDTRVLDARRSEKITSSCLSY